MPYPPSPWCTRCTGLLGHRKWASEKWFSMVSLSCLPWALMCVFFFFFFFLLFFPPFTPFLFFFFMDALAYIPSGIGCFLRKPLFLCCSEFIFPSVMIFPGTASEPCRRCLVDGLSQLGLRAALGDVNAPRHMLWGEILPVQQELTTKISRREAPRAVFPF